ncbi:MAG TPA: hypothetical protein VFI29_05175, partial [Hanamia sp.]|nr:hypothetical protein [Hanamia sp.]
MTNSPNYQNIPDLEYLFKLFDMLTTRVDYTTAARNLAFRRPLISSLITQVLFWCIAYFLLGTIIFFTSEVF